MLEKNISAISLPKISEYIFPIIISIIYREYKEMRTYVNFTINLSLYKIDVPNNDKAIANGILSKIFKAEQ